MKYYAYHIGDFRAGCINLTRLERWVYRDLLDVCYDTEAPLPADLDAVCRMVGARSQEDKEAVASVLDQKFTLTEVGYVNARVQREMEAFLNKSGKAKASAGKRWASSGADANAMRTHCEGIATQCEPDAIQCELDATQYPIPNTQLEAPTAAVAAPRSRGSRIPDGFPTASDLDWCQQNFPSLDAKAIAEQFVDYWRGAPGSKGVKLDWPATWRNWIRREAQRLGSGGRRGAAKPAGVYRVGQVDDDGYRIL